MKAALARTLTPLIILVCSASVMGQNGVGIGTSNPNPNAILDLVSPTGNQGLLVPRLTTAQRTNSSFTGNLSQSDNGLMVFDSDDGHLYFWMNSAWIQVRTGSQVQGLGDVLLAGNDANGNVITNLAAPVNASDAATKEYVDILDAADTDKDPTNEIQDLELQGATLRITGNAGATDIDLAPFTGTNTDNQTLSLSGTNLSITGGNAVDLAPIQDGFEANTDNQALSLSGTSLSISGGNAIDLAPIQDGTGTDNQQLRLSGTDLSISGGNTIDVSSLQDGFEANTDSQDLSLLRNVLSLTGDATPVDLTTYLDNTDSQQLSLAGTDLSISGGNTIDVSSLQDGTGTDNQVLRLSGTDLSISNGNSIDVSSLQDGFEANTDNQNLSFAGTTLSIAGGNSVNLSSLRDGTGTDSQNLDRVGNTLSISGGNTVTVAEQVAFKAITQQYSVGAGTSQLTFDAERYDISPRGGSFANNEFIAPLDGIYTFSVVFNAFFDTGVKGRLQVRVNGEVVQLLTIDTNMDNTTFPFTVDIQLAAGESVTLFLQTTTGANIVGYSTRTPNLLQTHWSGKMIVDLTR